MECLDIHDRARTHSEVEITCGHRSFSVRFIRMTHHIYVWSVGVTERKVFVACLVPRPLLVRKEPH